MTRQLYAYRLVVTYPEDSNEVDWVPEGWEAICEKKGWSDHNHPMDIPFAWPRRRIYFSSSAANERAELLRLYGATVTVERSNAITWPQLTDEEASELLELIHPEIGTFGYTQDVTPSNLVELEVEATRAVHAKVVEFERARR